MSRDVIASGATDRGRLRDVNEDRFHVDAGRGLFFVVDGVGGQAAGGKAADIATTMLRARLERETGAAADRVREAIVLANGEILRAAAMREEWRGMACVLTVAVVNDGVATIGHVGDTRLLKLREGRLQKITRDHSPVGEREDAGELTEAEAMSHPRRNEVYRDVGSEPHAAGDQAFIDIYEVPFEPDAALVLCSDGLTDLIDSAAIVRVVEQHTGDPAAGVRALIDAANMAGGRDNVTAVIVEGARFAAAVARRHAPAGAAAAPRRRLTDVLLGVLLAAACVAALVTLDRYYPLRPLLDWTAGAAQPPASSDIIVQPGQSIAAALARADVGTTVIVEPGEYVGGFALVSGVRVLSRVPRGATIQLAPGAVDRAAITASGVTAAEFSGFRIAGTDAMPLSTGLQLANSEVSIVDLEVTGASIAGVDIGEQSQVSIVGSDLHDNRGVALAIHSGASPRIANNTFARNGAGGRGLVIEPRSDPQFRSNVFHGLHLDVFVNLSDAARATLPRTNWFVDVPAPRQAAPATGRGRRGPG